MSDYTGPMKPLMAWDAAFSDDSWYALMAWAEYANNRFYNDKIDDRYAAIYLEAREAFLTEYLVRRGWRQIPGSKQWV